MEASDLDGLVHAAEVLAGSSDTCTGSVGIAIFGGQSMLFDIHEGKGHRTSVAAMVCRLVACNELLLRECGQGVATDLVGTLERAGS